MSPLILFKSLADETRLKTLLMLSAHGELCVCELTESLETIQPKISRHLALLKKNKLIQDRRQGQWVYYRLHDRLPVWVPELLQKTLAENRSLLSNHNKALSRMDRPAPVCCE